MVYPNFYSTVMANFAAYGYVVAGTDPYWPVESIKSDKTDTEKTFELLQWVCMWSRVRSLR